MSPFTQKNNKSKRKRAFAYSYYFICEAGECQHAY